MPMRKGNPVATQHRKPERLTMVIRHAVGSLSLRKLERSLRRVVRGSDRGGGMRNSENNPPHFASTEVVSGLEGRQSRQNAEDASRACCPGRVGMEVGKGQQAQARKNLGGRTPDSSDNEQDSAL